MQVVVSLERDSDNSDPGDATIAVFGSARGDMVSISLEDPERDVWITRADLEYALAAPVKKRT